MNNLRVFRLFFLTLALVFGHKVTAAESQFSGTFELENRYYSEEGKFENSDQSEISYRIKPNYNYSWDNSRKVIEFVPYVLLSDPDDEKTNFDIREASFVGSFGNLELRVGISKVFWGVAESVHLVDVVNQTDLVESIDGEEKLGQPMVSMTYISDYGNFSFFVLPFFRERTFPGNEGRLRTSVTVDIDNPEYETSKEDKNIDLALRWSKSISYFDLGLSHFYGTSRDPILRINSESKLTPHYKKIAQSGFDLQATYESLLVKHESVYRDYSDSSEKDFFTQVSGVEYSFYSIFESKADIGLLLEYISASEESNSLNFFDNHIFIGSRLALNDTQSTDLLVGVIADLEEKTKIISLESTRRLSGNLSGSLEYRQFIDVKKSNIDFLENDSYLQVAIEYGF